MSPLEPDRLLPPVSRKSQEDSSSFRLSGPPVTPFAIIKVIGGSLLAGLLIVFGLVHFYGKKADDRSLERVLVAPMAWQQLSFSEEEKGGKQTTYLTDKILLRSSNEGAMQTFTITPEEYEELYKLIAKDNAVMIVTDPMESKFDNPQDVIVLSLMVRPQERTGAAGASRVFQQVEFLIDGSCYRVNLRRESNKTWKYFHHDFKLNETLLRILVDANEKKQ